MRRVSILLWAVLAIAGCCHTPSQEQLAKADCGPAPTNHEELIRAYFQEVLIDPVSAQYEIGSPQRGCECELGRYTYGWRVQVRVNAKNKLGGYVGWKRYFFLLRNESIVQTNEDFAYNL